MKRKSYIDRILNFLNNDYNRGTYPNANFNLYADIESIVKNKIIEDILTNYGLEKNGDEYIHLIESWIRKNYGNGVEALRGDDVILIEMPDDPNPIEVGTKGRVININTVYGFGEDYLIVHWENGRRLNLIRGIDEYDVDINYNNQYLKDYIKTL